jgi:hypothetical protein
MLSPTRYRGVVLTSSKLDAYTLLTGPHLFLKSLYPAFHFFVGDRALPVGVFEAALDHQVENEFTDDLIVRAIIRFV